MRAITKLLLPLLLLMPMGLMAQELKGADADTTIMIMVEEQPEYPGGMKGMSKDVFGNLKYPNKAKEEGRQGKVIVEFVVEKDGSISHVKAIQDEVGYGAGEEVVRVVKNMKPFTPGKVGGKTVRTKYRLPVNFELYEDPPAKSTKKHRRNR
ncbi:MAG: energy transducer TonB [Bacteroidales bacterium]|nr:energy transducer TonB [Bacteroidales bacterium]